MSTSQMLFERGLIQFGRFDTTDGWQPMRYRLEALSAYPDLMRQIVDDLGAIAQGIVPHIDYFVSAADCIPVSSILCDRLDQALVYSKGCGDAPVHDLIGSYDVGHPSCLIVNAITVEVKTLIANCHRAGLEISDVITLIDTGITLSSARVHGVYQIGTIVDELQKSNQIPSAQVDVIRARVKSEKTAL